MAQASRREPHWEPHWEPQIDHDDNDRNYDAGDAVVVGDENPDVDNIKQDGEHI